jgi:hypothetical protein
VIEGVEGEGESIRRGRFGMLSSERARRSDERSESWKGWVR